MNTPQAKLSDVTKCPPSRLIEKMEGMMLTKWKDLIWRFPPTTPGASVSAVGWSFKLPGGQMSTDCSELLESFKILLAGSITLQGSSHTRIATSAVGAFGSGARELFRWMKNEGLNRFEDLSPSYCEKYLEDMPELITLREKFYLHCGENLADVIDAEYNPLEDEVPKVNVDDAGLLVNNEQGLDTDEEISYRQVSCRISLLYQIYELRSFLEESSATGMHEPPFGAKALSSVVGAVAPFVANAVPPLPDEVAVPLLQAAVSWSDFRWRDVIRLRDEYLSYREHGGNHPLKDFQFSELSPGAGPWRGPVVEEKREHINLGPQNLVPTQVVRNLMMTVRDAAITLIFFMVGMRPGEVCSIEVIKGRGLLHGCVQRRTSKSGLMELFFVKGSVSKDREAPEPAEWLIACRPVGATWVPATLSCIEMVVELFKPWTHHLPRHPLFLQFTNALSLPTADSQVVQAGAAALCRGLQNFASFNIDWQAVPDLSRRGESLRVLKETRGFSIRSVHGRKTFAAYVLETRSSLLEAVSRHFKHLGTAVTEGSYFPKEYRQRHDADVMRKSATVQFMEDLLVGEVQLAGRMAPIIEEFLSKPEWSKLRSRGDARRAVTAFVDSHSTRIYFSRHGSCFLSMRPLDSRCRQDSGTASWLNTVPDYRHRTPSNCSGCAAFLVDGSHYDYWKSRANESVKGSTAEFRVAIQRKEQAKKIVAMLDRSFNEAGERNCLSEQ